MKEQRTRMKFTEIDDIKLIKIVNQMEKIEWKEVSLSMGKWTPRQCRDRYNNYLSPRVQNKKWTKEEDQILLEKFAIYGPKWSFLSHFFNNRAAVNIKNHYSKLSARSQLKTEGKNKKDDMAKFEALTREKENSTLNKFNIYDQFSSDDDNQFDSFFDEVFLL